ncbi:hypothetical protein NDU88_005032 [Pleurodeles waltl]|uniref:Uncharacterized protein n=1 Tax=Pleurodeles waltl TaxID=8319 RepID=A0AAV7TBE1_PLEWA|nr:hypothetical protein NDU88_005032 [Pleurodeles waltl]
MEPVHLSRSRQPVTLQLRRYRHSSQSTTSCRSPGHPLPRPDHTTGLTTREAWWQPQQGVAAPPVSSASRPWSLQGHNSTDPSPTPYTASGPLSHSATTRPPSQGTRELGAAVQPDRRSAPWHVRRPTGVHSGCNHNQPPAPKGPTGQQHTGRPCAATPTSRLRGAQPPQRVPAKTA